MQVCTLESIDHANGNPYSDASEQAVRSVAEGDDLTLIGEHLASRFALAAHIDGSGKGAIRDLMKMAFLAGTLCGAERFAQGLANDAASDSSEDFPACGEQWAGYPAVPGKDGNQ